MSLRQKIRQTKIYQSYRQSQKDRKKNRIREKVKKLYLKNFGYAPEMYKDFLPGELTLGTDYFSQLGQELYVLNMVFPGKKDGVFVDVGANDPIEISNTYLLEKLGWRGIAFEPQLKLCEAWKTERTTPCFPYVLGENETTVSFVESSVHGLSGVKGYAEDKIHGRVHEEGVYSTREQKRLDTVLIEHDIRNIDFMSLDVEGYELNVLKGVDFSVIKIKCIILENDKTAYGDDEVRKFLIEKGYRFVARIHRDDVFILN